MHDLWPHTIKAVKEGTHLKYVLQYKIIQMFNNCRKQTLEIEHGHNYSIQTVSYTHLDVYKRQ